jgi:SAM-dependent methyltransferase
VQLGDRERRQFGQDHTVTSDPPTTSSSLGSCPVCDARIHPLRHDWCFMCPACGFLASNLKPHIGDAQDAGVLNEERCEIALAALRKKNFERNLDRIDSMSEPSRRTLLEVGCAHGWFLDLAVRRRYEVHGIEPDAPVGALALSKGHDVSIGFFPRAVTPGTRYEVIVFNDVFEHLPDPRAALTSCRQLLRLEGLPVVNLPSSRGTFFRIATLLDRLGISGPHERMWQKGFPSPHLSYFAVTVTQLARREGFAELYRGTLVTIDRRGLWQRLRFDRRSSLLGAAVAWLGIMLASPLLVWLPSDITLQIYRPAGTRPAP